MSNCNICKNLLPHDSNQNEICRVLTKLRTLEIEQNLTNAILDDATQKIKQLILDQVESDNLIDTIIFRNELTV